MEDKEEGQKKKSRERKKKDSHPLMFQNRFCKLSEERIYGKKRLETAEANINAVN